MKLLLLGLTKILLLRVMKILLLRYNIMFIHMFLAHNKQLH